jgi:hypothetical protein
MMQASYLIYLIKLIPCAFPLHQNLVNNFSEVSLLEIEYLKQTLNLLQMTQSLMGFCEGLGWKM